MLRGASTTTVSNGKKKEISNVAGGQPTASENLTARLGRFEVAGKASRATQEYFPHPAGLDDVRSSDAHFDSRKRPAAGDVAVAVNAQRLSGTQAGHTEGGLRQTVTGTDHAGYTEALLEGDDRALPNRFSAVGGEAQRRQAET